MDGHSHQNYNIAKQNSNVTQEEYEYTFIAGLNFMQVCKRYQNLIGMGI